MRTAQRISNLLGLGGERGGPPPQYAALADGLIITDTHAEAWLTLSSANTDLMSVADRDAQLDQADQALGRVLAGYDCHLRVLWSPLRADDYLYDAASMFTAGDWEAWAQMRVRRLEQIGMDTRHLLLGVRLADRTGPVRQAGARAVRGALGTGAPPVSKRELAGLSGQMRTLVRRLEVSPWRAEPAPVESLAWLVAREQHRTAPLPAPRDGAITGAQIATLTRGRIEPYPDHLRIVGADGTTTAWSSVLTMPSFPSALDTPGGGEWLRSLSEITYVPPAGDDDEAGTRPVPVSPEASVRFRVLPKRDALRKVDKARKSAKEQRRSAANQSAGDPGRDIEATEAEMAELKVSISRDGVDLVDDHPRIVVTSTESLEDLRARVDAVVAHYAGADIEVVTGEDEQRELWCEMQPGDRVRVPDVGHTRDVTALSASWFWGGARVGDTEGPIVGFLTGSTPGVVRLDVTAGSDAGDATTTAFLGRSGRGKSTAVAMCCLDAAFRGAFALILDFKGDLGGVVDAAAAYGLPARLVQTTSKFAGSADLFTLLEGHEAAQVEVPAQLTIAAPPHLRARGAETPITRAVNAVIRGGGTPATWQVVEYLRTMDDALGRETGEALYELAQTGLGAPFMGRPADGTPLLTPEPGVWVVQMPGLSLPDAATHMDQWHPLQRLSVALMHSMLAYGVTTAGRRDLRGMRKVLAVPEVHVLTATRQGQAFLSYIARVGRALGTALLLDSQDAVALARIVGVVEQLRTVVGFQLTTEEEQNALCGLLGLPANEHTRAMIQAIGRLPSGAVRHGHSIIRDAQWDAATTQWDIPSAELLAMLDTSPKASADTTDATDHTAHETVAHETVVTA
ncbi:ATP-binding protein [Streptomyces rubiginosohelvolus]|uniref:ATP-binding protein n=1 Tax=Streptomyces rubiginosohelvolus TaxID=67362 RepID=UPI0037ADA1CD